MPKNGVSVPFLAILLGQQRVSKAVQQRLNPGNANPSDQSESALHHFGLSPGKSSSPKIWVPNSMVFRGVIPSPHRGVGLLMENQICTEVQISCAAFITVELHYFDMM